MKAVYINEFSDDLDRLELREIPDPEGPGPGEVTVRVHAAGINRADLLQARGRYPPPAGYSANIPGLEFAGEVISAGIDVTTWNVGDRVCGITAGEAQAELLVIDHSLLIRIPDRLSYAEAAALPEAFITAHDAVFTQGSLAAGELLLIHAVGSGVGLAALQMAKVRRSHVIGTSRTSAKLERCREFGLDHGIEVREITEIAPAVLEMSGGRGTDVILDLVGAAYFSQNMKCLAQKGRLLLVGLTSGAKADLDLGVALQKRAKVIGTVLRSRSIEEKAEATGNFVKEIIPSIEAGTIRPNLDRVFDAKDAVEAYKYVSENKNFGKVVLNFNG